MKIFNKVYRLKKPLADFNGWLNLLSSTFVNKLEINTYPLRFSIVDVVNDELVIEATIIQFNSDNKYAATLNEIEIFNLRKKQFQIEPFVAVHIVPTGVRCDFGGFAGDATPATNLLSSAVDFLITHPNAVNASDINEMESNVLYVEGKSLDDFLLGYIALLPVIKNKIGTFIDGEGAEYMNKVINVINAARATKGIECGLYTLLNSKLGIEIEWSKTGCAVGTILHPEVLLEGVELLISQGVNAIGGVSVIHNVKKEMLDRHLKGEIPNPSGGVEAIITHLISKIFKIPTAHAPLPYYEKMKDQNIFNPRASAEFISTPHYFSVLKGLNKAPRPIPINDLNNVSHLISLNNVGAIVLPADCLGGLPALAAEYNNIPIIAVRDNKTILEVNNEMMEMTNVIEVNSFLEAAGMLLALRKGISLESLRRPISPANEIFKKVPQIIRNYVPSSSLD